MKILITGGCGFIGHHFVEHIHKSTEWNIIIIDKLTYASNGFERLRDTNTLDSKRVKVFTIDLINPLSDGIKKEIGNAIPTNNNTYAVKGRDLRSGTPKEVNITEEDTAEALNDILKEMVNGIKDALESTPPELSADLVDMGLTLTGGGALLKNIDRRFSKETGLPVHIADDPLSCVAVGTGKALDQEQTFSTMLTEY